MGILLDFEEEKKKLFNPAEQTSTSEKLAKVKDAATAFLFSRKSLHDRVFMTLRSLFDSNGVAVDDVQLAVVTEQILPYAQAHFTKPYVLVSNGPNEATR